MDIENRVENYVAAVQEKYKVHINADLSNFSVIFTVYKEQDFDFSKLSTYGVKRCYKIFGEPLFSYTITMDYMKYELRDDFYLKQFDMAFKMKMLERVMKEYKRDE